MKKSITILLALLLLMESFAFADVGNVTYVGGAEKFIFLPGSDYSDTDLFDNFKNVMPGDTLTQVIKVQNKSMNRVRIFMKAEGCSEEDREFLNQLKLNVKSSKGDIFEAQADETAQLTDWVNLGVFRRKGEANLNVTLTVPIELDNKYMNRIGTLAWSFQVEVIDDDTNPETGDWFDATVWVCCAAVVLTAGVVVLILSKKRVRAK